MHEISLATGILETCERLAGPGIIESVRVEVGELSSVEPDLLDFAWTAVVSGTPHEGSRLCIDWVPARQSCSRCGRPQARQPGQWFPYCTECGSPLDIEGGYEMNIVELSYREPAPAEVTFPKADVAWGGKG